MALPGDLPVFLAFATASHSLGEMPGLGKVTAKEVYAALDLLGREQPFIEAKLAGRHLKDGALLLYDVTSIYRRAAVPVRRQRA
jgi:hypothetical protein